MNLGVARSINKVKDVGIRKVVGAPDFKIRDQFLGESIIMALLAAGLALVWVELMLPLFNQLVERSLSLDFSNIINLSSLFMLTVNYNSGSWSRKLSGPGIISL